MRVREDQLKGLDVVVVIVADQECPAWLSGGGSVIRGWLPTEGQLDIKLIPIILMKIEMNENSA